MRNDKLSHIIKHHPLRLLFFIIMGGALCVLVLVISQEKTDMPQSSHVESELKRIRSLLAPSRVNMILEEIAADPSPESLGAEAGIGFKASDPDIQFSVYIFNDWDGSNTTADELYNQHKDEAKVYAPIVTNGSLVFYGVVHTDDPDGTTRQFALADFVSAFSGDE